MNKKNTIFFPISIEKDWDIAKLMKKGDYKRTYLLKKQIGNDTCILQVIQKHHFSKTKYRRISRLSCKYIVLPTEYRLYKGNCFILYPKFATLQDTLADKGLSLEEIYQLGIDMTYAVSELMQNHIYHADISPTNIYHGSNGHFCLGDLDVLRPFTGATPEYTAPERKINNKNPFHKKDSAVSFDLSMQYAIGKLVLTLLQLCTEFDNPEITCIPAKACLALPEKRYSSLTIFQSEMKKFSHSPAIDIPSSTLHIARKNHTLFQSKTGKLPTQKAKIFFPILWSTMILACCILLILLVFCKEPQGKKNAPSVYELHQTIKYEKAAITPSHQKSEKKDVVASKELDIQGNNSSTLGEAISCFPSEKKENVIEYNAVECLYAGKNKLTDISSVSLFPQIREIYLNQNSLRDKDALLPLLQLNQLETLVLSQNNLQEIPDLSKLKKLVHLDLSSNPRFHDIHNLSKLTQLRFLNLSGTNIRQKDIKILKTKFPECEIIF